MYLDLLMNDGKAPDRGICEVSVMAIRAAEQVIQPCLEAPQ